MYAYLYMYFCIEFPSFFMYILSDCFPFHLFHNANILCIKRIGFFLCIFIIRSHWEYFLNLPEKGAGIVWFSSEMMILFCRSSTRFIGLILVNFILVEWIDTHWMNKANTILYWKSIDRLIENLEKIIFLLPQMKNKNHFQNCQLNVFCCLLSRK